MRDHLIRRGRVAAPLTAMRIAHSKVMTRRSAPPLLQHPDAVANETSPARAPGRVRSTPGPDRLSVRAHRQPALVPDGRLAAPVPGGAGLRVTHVKNITDVGHMRQDMLERGEDKVIAAALAAGRTPQEIAQFYTERSSRTSES